MDTNTTVTPEPTETPKPKRWPWIAGIVAAFLLGTGIGAAGGDTAPVATEPRVVTETVVETVTEAVEIETVPQACKDLVVSLRDYIDISLAAMGEMADILDRDGYLITDEYVEILDAATAGVNGDPGQFHSDACGV